MAIWRRRRHRPIGSASTANDQWLLTGGIWSDAGVWEDSDVWQD